MDFLTNLHRKLTGRAQDKHLRETLSHINLRQSGQCESRRFPGTGCGKTEDILAGEGGRYAECLNGRRALIAENFDGCE